MWKWGIITLVITGCRDYPTGIENPPFPINCDSNYMVPVIQNSQMEVPTDGWYMAGHLGGGHLVQSNPGAVDPRMGEKHTGKYSLMAVVRQAIAFVVVEVELPEVPKIYTISLWYFMHEEEPGRKLFFRFGSGHVMLGSIKTNEWTRIEFTADASSATQLVVTYSTPNPSFLPVLWSNIFHIDDVIITDCP